MKKKDESYYVDLLVAKEVTDEERDAEGEERRAPTCKIGAGSSSWTAVSITLTLLHIMDFNASAGMS